MKAYLDKRQTTDGDETKSFSLDVRTLQPPSEFRLGDQIFGESTKGGDVGNVEDRLLLDPSVSSSDSDRSQRELTQK